MFYIMIFFLIMSVINSFLLKFPQFKIFSNLKRNKNKKARQTFWLGLATNLGVGNLIGVSSAIYIGGPGVIFWMAIFAFFASSFAYSETYYGIDSQIRIDDETRSSTSFTILKYFKGKLGMVLASIFACFLVLTNSIFFPPIQMHAVTKIFSGSRSIIVGLFLILFIIIITSKGIKNIIKFTDHLMPFIAISYTICIIFMILVNYKELPDAINLIFREAFSLKSMASATIYTTIQVGISKSLFSHEAGLGTMPSLVGMSEKKDTTITCYYQVLSVIIDTIVLCSLTGIFIIQITKGEMNGNLSLILSNCFENVLGKNGLVISKIFIILFGVSSIIGQFYLGETNALFFTIFQKNTSRILKFIFKILFYFGLFLGIFLSFETIDMILNIGMILLGMINMAVIFIIYFKTKKEHKILEEFNLK